MAGERDPEDESWRDEGIIAAIRNGKPLGSFQRARLLDMLAAPSPEPLPLDVERLTRAIDAAQPLPLGWMVDGPEPRRQEAFAAQARSIAAEYDRLREPDRPT